MPAPAETLPQAWSTRPRHSSGGTAYAGLTCSALTAGVMLIGLAVGGSKLGSRWVLRAIAGMALGGHAFAEI